MATTCKLIAKSTLGADAASVTLGSGGTIPQTYTDLLLIMSVRSTKTGANWGNIALTFNASGSGYKRRLLYGNGSSATSTSNTSASNLSYHYATAASAPADTFGSIEIYIPNYAGSTYKSTSSTSVTENNATAAFIAADAGLWENTAAITSIEIDEDDSNNLKSGSSFFLYGITKA